MLSQEAGRPSDLQCGSADGLAGIWIFCEDSMREPDFLVEKTDGKSRGELWGEGKGEWRPPPILPFKNLAGALPSLPFPPLQHHIGLESGTNLWMKRVWWKTWISLLVQGVLECFDGSTSLIIV